MPTENVPKITIVFGIESNTAFFVACFVLMCALAWAIRDHRRRQLEMATAEQEDHLYLAVLSILFIICTMGAYYAFKRTTAQRLLDVYGQPMEAQIEEEIAERLREYLPDKLKDRDDKDLFMMALAAIFIITLAIGGYFIWMKRAACVQTQYPSGTAEPAPPPQQQQ